MEAWYFKRILYQYDIAISKPYIFGEIQTMNRSDEDKALLEDMKKVLDEQVGTLGFPIRSRLTQARFHAIDRGLLKSSTRFSDYGRMALSGAVLAAVFTLTSLVALNMQDQATSNKEISSLLPEVNQGSINTLNAHKDTKEEIEIYNWLFDHYGIDS